MFIIKSFSKLQKLLSYPSSIAINKENIFFYRYGQRNIFWFPIELTNFFKWIVLGLFKYIKFDFKSYKINKKEFLLACIFNSFQPKELILLSKLDITTWDEIRKITPSNMINLINSEERLYWPNKCADAINLLNNKEKLYELTPKKWRPYYITSFEYKNNLRGNASKNKFFQKIINNYIKKSGIIIKPNSGCRSKDIFIYKKFKNKVFYKNLFKVAPDNGYKPTKINSEKIEDFFDHWTKITKNKNLLLMNYVNSNSSFATSYPSPVIRVITEKKFRTENIKVINSWIEICIENNFYFIELISGKCYSRKFNQFLKVSQEYILREWIKDLQIFKQIQFIKCLNASVEMHKKIPPINKVAWDWIPQDNNPILLEGNSNFNLLTPQLLNLL